MFLCLKKFDEIIHVGNLLDYGLAKISLRESYSNWV